MVGGSVVGHSFRLRHAGGRQGGYRVTLQAGHQKYLHKGRDDDKLQDEVIGE